MENNKKQEETKDIDRYEKIVEFARDEVAGVRTVYIWLATTLGIIIATGLTIGTILIGHSVSDMKKSMNDEIDKVQQQVNSRIDEEFKKDKIQSLIEDKAREYAKISAQQYIATEVNEVITPFKNEIKNTTHDANEQIQKLNNLYYILYIANHAKSGSKSAYLSLIQYATKGRPEEVAIAIDNLKQIIRDLNRYRHVAGQSSLARRDLYRNDVNNIQICIKDDSVDALTDYLIKEAATDDDRQVLMEYISKKPKDEIFNKAIQVFDSDSLPACAIFCGILSDISEENPEPDFLNFGAWAEICRKHVNKQ